MSRGGELDDASGSGSTDARMRGEEKKRGRRRKGRLWTQEEVWRRRAGGEGAGGTHIAGDGQRVLSRGFLLPDLDRDLGSRRASIRTLHRGRLGSSALFFDEAVCPRLEVVS